MQFLRVFLRSSAGEVELSTVSPAPFKLLDGARGLGLPVRSVESTPLPSANGSVFRSGRFDESEVYLPIAMNDRDASRVAERSRQLENVLQVFSDDPIELVVEAPELGTVRRRYVYYTGGLEGAVGGEDSHFTWRHVPVKFLALDPMWYGQERVLTQKVDAARKPFITKKVDPVLTGRENLALNPRYQNGLSGNLGDDTQLAGGGGVLSVEDGWAKLAPTTGNGLTVYGVDSRRFDPDPWHGKTFTVSVTLRLDSPLAGSLHAEARTINFNYLDADNQYQYYAARSERAPNEAGEYRLSVTGTVPDDARAWFVRFVGGSAETPTYWTDVQIEEGDTATEFFDGDSPISDGLAYGWSGEPHNSTSVEVEAESVRRAPFFPVVLASSTVDGAYQLDIGRDAEAWPIWEIDGPGEDLLIENVRTGERIFINGEFTETVTIDTRPTIADIYSTTEDDGQLWERVDDDYKLFPLTPGENRIKITMVNANPKSVVRLKYSETWLAGW